MANSSFRPSCAFGPNPDLQRVLGSTFHLVHRGRLHTVRIARAGGALDHYYHFIMDLAWPLHEWARTHGGWSAKGTLYTTDTKACYFAGHFKRMLGKTIRPAPAWVRGLDRVGAARRVELIGFNTRVRDHARVFPDLQDFQRSRAAFVATIALRIGGGTEHEHQPQVVLIERAAGTGDRGATRRSIEGQADLVERTAAVCAALGARFRTVRMEDMTISEQFDLMRKGPTILVGQHGAGLLNGLWMEHPGSAVIELAAEDNPAHFQNLFTDLGMRYTRLVQRSTGVYGRQQLLVVDAAEVAQAIERTLRTAARS